MDAFRSKETACISCHFRSSTRVLLVRAFTAQSSDFDLSVPKCSLKEPLAMPSIATLDTYLAFYQDRIAALVWLHKHGLSLQPRNPVFTDFAPMFLEQSRDTVKLREANDVATVVQSLSPLNIREEVKRLAPKSAEDLARIYDDIVWYARKPNMPRDALDPVCNTHTHTPHLTLTYVSWCLSIQRLRVSVGATICSPRE